MYQRAAMVVSLLVLFAVTSIAVPADAEKFSATDIDWAADFKLKSDVDNDRHTIIRLRMAASDGEQNQVWLLHTDSVSGIDTHYLAFRGQFEFKRDPRDKENLIILVSFSKKYQAQRRLYGGELDWMLDTHYLPEGGELHLPLTDDVLKRKKHLLTLVRPFYVDEQGKELNRSESPRTVFEKVSGRGAAKQLRQADFLPTGTVLRLERTDSTWKKVIKSPPPGLPSRE